MLICANAQGNHKVKLCVVGKFAKLRCFKGITKLPVVYHALTVMDAEIFTK